MTTQAFTAFDGFHFANKVTIGMRTPGHVFRSLGLCTIAAIPIVSEDATTAPITDDGYADRNDSSDSLAQLTTAVKDRQRDWRTDSVGMGIGSVGQGGCSASGHSHQGSILLYPVT